MKTLFCLLFSFFGLISFAQEKQSGIKQVNKTGSEIYADAPWRMKIRDSSGNIAGIPVHINIHDADVIGYNAELIGVSVYIKNASSAAFGTPILFNNYSDSAFLSLFSARSPNDAVMGIQSFDASLPVKSSTSTVSFTSDNCSWPDNCTYTDIISDKWYFTITIPPDKLIGLDSIVDIKVYFDLNWQTDVSTMLRVFRYHEDMPQLDNWYRGDTHFHTIYTSNSAEIGLSLQASKEAAKVVGLDWITTTDHSCDFDNYGISMPDNWQRLGNDVLACNQNDSSFIFIRAIEASVNNSNSDVIHFLAYPNDTFPLSMPYLGDGNGDISSTTKTIDDILYTLSENGGFAYAAHPFAGGDKLSSLVDGGIWNISDSSFFPNNTAIPGNDVVICNTTTVPSDVYSTNIQQHLFKALIKGGEIWNSRYTMGTTDEYLNPWNVEYDSGTEAFAPYDTSTNKQYHMNRFLQNLEVTRFLNKKGLISKNSNPTLQSYRFYMTAGSDAHGSFNYSNTEFVMGLTGDINDNAIGKPSTLVYCPGGMGANGENILKALKNGRAILSDGPIISIGIDTLANNNPQFVSGDEAILTSAAYQNASISIKLKSTYEYGTINTAKLIFGTVNGEIPLVLNLNGAAYNFQINLSLDSLEQSIQTIDTIAENEFYYIRAEMSTLKNYGAKNQIFCKNNDIFRSYTNPIWVKKAPGIVTTTYENIESLKNINIYPNPFDNNAEISFFNDKSAIVVVDVFDSQGKLIQHISRNYPSGNNTLLVDPGKKGIFIFRFSSNGFNKFIKAVKI